MPRGVYNRASKPAVKAQATKNPRPVKSPVTPKEKILTETTSDNAKPEVSPNPETTPVITAPIPKGKMTEAMVIDPETGRYTKQIVPIEVLAEPQDHFANDPMGLGPDWDNTRGREMHAHWANANPKYRTVEAQRKYRPVDPNSVPDDIRNRFMVAEVDGYPGECLVYGDAVLVEVPLWLKKHRDVQREKLEKARNAELWGFGTELDNLNERAKSGGWNSRHGATMDTQIGGHIDDMADPRETLHGYAPGDDHNSALADAEIEAEYEARRGSNTTFGGFQGTPKYNQTRWSRDAR